MNKIKLEPIHELFYNKESLYGIYSCSIIDNLTPENDIHTHPIYKTMSLVGNMPKLNLYHPYTINCSEIIDKRYGKQYQFLSFEVNKLNSTEEQADFLRTLLTPLQVTNILKVYDKPVDVIVDEKFDYKLVHGIGAKLYKKIRKKILENYVFFRLLSELGKYNITFTQIKKLYDKYKNADTALSVVKENPYVLMDLPGVGFKRADAIALNMGVEKNDTKRIIACAEYLLSKESDSGHIWSDINYIQDKLSEYIDYDIFIDKCLLDYISENYRFKIVDDYKLTLVETYNVEKNIAKELLRLNNNKSVLNVDIERFIKRQESEQGFKYDEKQKEVFYSVAKNNIFVLTGYGGTGKTTLVNGLLEMFDMCDLDYVLMSPSAKAAKVLQAYTNRPASTIHRGLGWTPEGFKFNENDSLPYDVVIIDEISMVGIYLFNSLIKAIDNNTKLILVGDVGQLPSIEPGSILDDILKSNLFFNMQLTKVFRQAEKSGIIQVATKTRNGEYFVKNKEEEICFYGDDKDCILIPCKKEKTINKIMQVYKHLLNKGYNDDDIMVTVPTRKNSLGTIELNNMLQHINNPEDENKVEINCGYKGEKLFREGDKVIHIVNNYKAVWHILDENNEFEPIDEEFGIFNGDIGRIERIIDEDGDKFIYVKYGDKYMLYENGDSDQLELAWGLTTHRLQGSAARVIVLGLDSRSYFMVKRNWLYTAVTRARELLVMCVDPSIVNNAINNDEILEKRTFLRDLLVKSNNNLIN